MIVRPNPPPESQPAPAAIRPGTNLRLGQNPMGMWFEGPAGGGDFRGYLAVTVSGAGARVGQGWVIANIAVEPLIGNVPITGSANQPIPVLPLSASLVNSRNESWICVEVTPDADGRLDAEGKDSTVEIVQRDHPIVTAGETGRAPLAMLIYRDARDVRPQVQQIAWFNFRYETSQPSDGPRRHYFL